MPALTAAALELPVLREPRAGECEGDEPAGDRRRAGAAVGQQHVAVDQDRTLAERGHVDHRPQAASDETLDLLRAPPGAAPLALDALRGRRADHAGAAHLDQDRALGRRQESRNEANRP
jgi:hypothetical protein